VNQATGWVLAGQPQRAVPLAHEALALFERFRQPYGLAAANQILAEAHLALAELESAERFAWRALETEETGIVPEALRTLGEVCLARQETRMAEQHIRQAIEEARRNQSPYLEAYGWRALGRVYKAERAMVEASSAFEKAISMFDELGLQQESEKTRTLM
jgi:tetratricopeptide (TPR) repeat protein